MNRSTGVDDRFQYSFVVVHASRFGVPLRDTFPRPSGKCPLGSRSVCPARRSPFRWIARGLGRRLALLLQSSRRLGRVSRQHLGTSQCIWHDEAPAEHIDHRLGSDHRRNPRWIGSCDFGRCAFPAFSRRIYLLGYGSRGTDGSLGSGLIVRWRGFVALKELGLGSGGRHALGRGAQQRADDACARECS